MKPTFTGNGCRLYRGEALTIMGGLADASVHLVLTDPPYGHNNADGGDLISRARHATGVVRKDHPEHLRPIANDGVEANELYRQCLPLWQRLLTAPGTVCCCCGGGGPDPQFARWTLWMAKVFDFKQMIVWDKGPIGMGWHYRRSYEVVLVGEKGGAAWYDRTGRVENVIRPGFKGIRKIIPQQDQHPTAKPVELMRHFIELHTQPGDVVLDPFLGGGTTAVACVQTGRQCIGIELDEQHFDLAVQRVQRAHRLPGLLDEPVTKPRKKPRDVGLGFGRLPKNDGKD